jgi:hypothetical protein
VGAYRARLGIYLGGRRRVPHDVMVVNNTILSGATRRNGYAGSIGLSWAYKNVPRNERPIIANNVIALLQTSQPVCAGARMSVANVVVSGRGCSSADGVGPVNLDSRGRPTAESTLVIDRANRRYAPATDITGRRRASANGGPDIGAYEYVARRSASRSPVAGRPPRAFGAELLGLLRLRFGHPGPAGWQGARLGAVLHRPLATFADVNRADVGESGGGRVDDAHALMIAARARARKVGAARTSRRTLP